MKNINRRERRESCACTGSVSRTAMLRGSVARPSLSPPPPSRDEHREHNQRHVVYSLPLACCRLLNRKIVLFFRMVADRRRPATIGKLDTKFRFRSVHIIEILYLKIVGQQTRAVCWPTIFR